MFFFSFNRPPVDLPMPLRSSQTTTTPEEHYGKIFVRYLESVKTQFKERFSADSRDLVKYMTNLQPETIRAKPDEELLQEKIEVVKLNI